MYFLILAVLFVSVIPTFAQTSVPLTSTQSTSATGMPTQSISGDSLCGSTVATACKASDLKKLGKALVFLIATLGSVLLFVFVMIRVTRGVIAKFTGDASGLAQARNDSGNAIVGFIIALAAVSILLAGLKILGAKPETTQLLRLFSSTFIDPAYAQEQLLPNPLGSNSLYDIIIAGANLAMRFFVYPSIIAAWVASGFKFIYSQGNPEGLKTARNWLLISFIFTIVAFSLQGFILAFRATAEKILPTSSEQQTTTPVSPTGTVDGRGQPAPTPGSSCGLNGGIMGTDGVCYVGGRR